jgi:hypothetical protein
MNYADFFSEADVAAYKRVKRGAMRLARIARAEAAALVGGYVRDEGKEFVVTSRGVYRLAMAANSDNTTERAAHARMGAETVNMGDDVAMSAWFTKHDLAGAGTYFTWRRRIATVLAGREAA